MKFAVVNLGCKVNRVESDDVAALLSTCAQASAQSDADVIVINTCTVTGEAEKKTRKAVRHALRVNDHAKVLVTGCAVAIDAPFYEALDARIETVAKPDLVQRIAKLVEEVSSSESGKACKAMPPMQHASGVRMHAASENAQVRNSAFPLIPLPIGEGFRSRVGVKVQDGCNNACTYCIVHVARGRAISRSAQDVIAECVALASAGVQEIVLTGINLGSYRDSSLSQASPMRLADLLSVLLEETQTAQMPSALPVRFRVSSIEPRDVDDALIEILARAQGRICRHLHLPLQAGSNKVLHEMARPYCVEEYCLLVQQLRSALPMLSLSTDIIVGFPGETDDEFAQTLEVALRCAFSKIHVFPYSKRVGTPAAVRTDQIDAEVKAQRATTLRNLGESLRQADWKRRVGTYEYALVEENGLATTESYYQIEVPVSARPGSLIQVCL